MRTFAAAALISIAAHTAAVAFAPTHVAPRPRPIVTAPAPAPDPDPQAEPFEVQLLVDEPAIPTTASAAIVAATHGAPGPAAQVARTTAISTGQAATAETPATTPEKPHSSLMTMRKPELGHGPSAELIQHFLENSKPLVRPADVGGDQTRQDLAAMDARLHDREHVANGDPVAIQNERIARDAKAQEVAAVELHPDGNGTYKSDQGPYAVKIARDGSVKIKDARNLQVDGILPIGIAGHFDTTDWIMRNHGMDPYASAKRAFLDRTRDARVELGTRDRKEQLKKSPALMQQHLDHLWATVRDPAERKQTLFELWDECAETGTTELVSAAAGARALVVGFIHARQIVYSQAELTALNAHRQSTTTFAP